MMDLNSNRPSSIVSPTTRLIIINLVTLFILVCGFFLVTHTFGRVSEIFDYQVSRKMKMAVTSFSLGKALVNIDGEVHDADDIFLHNPEEMVVARGKILNTIDDLFFQIKTTENYFDKEDKQHFLLTYRSALEERLNDNVKIAEIVLRLDMLNDDFLNVLDVMEKEAGKLIVEKVLNGFDPTGLHQVNALLPFCREQVLKARFLMERAVVELNYTLLVSNAEDEKKSLIYAVNLFLQTLKTLTSANPQIADNAAAIIAEGPTYLSDVMELSRVIKQKQNHHVESERIRGVILETLSRVDRESAEVLSAIGKRSSAEMNQAIKGLNVLGTIVLLFTLVSVLIAHMIGRRILRDSARKEDDRIYLSKKMSELENEVVRRHTAEQQAVDLAKNMEKLVDERTAELTAVNLELEAFVYSMSHDLRTPLRGIAGFSNALMEDYGESLDHAGQQYIQRIQKAGIDMGKVIDEILELSRLTRAELVKEKVDLSAVAETIVQELRNNQPERTVDVHIAQGLSVVASREQIRAVLTNLLGNAWKFTSKNAHAKILFSSAKIDGKTTFFIQDNGVGFNMAYSEKMFGAFQRLHSVDEFPGAGIGLALVQRVIKRHNGEIWAESRVGEGAIFYFRV